MIRATTPKHIFIFDQDPTQYARILITYAQLNKTVMELEKDDLTIEEIPGSDPVKWQAWYRMSQEETKLFSALPEKSVRIQVRVLTGFGDALASEMLTTTISDVLNDEVLE